jgi:hypothetical protein
MEGFLDLANLYQQIKNEIGSMSYVEMELPEAFKSNVTTIGDRSISYHKYTAIAYKTRADSIIIPNFWFYLAVKILPYNIELHRYYDKIISMNLFSSQRLNDLKRDDVNLSNEETQIIDMSFSSTDDANRIKRFLTDYRWWHGGKELGRVQKDYFVSAVLSLSGLVNDSATYLSTLCELVRTRSDLANLLRDYYNKQKDYVSIIEINGYSAYRFYEAAIKSKPFLLLAGISGTGKSRIVRELARACWEEDSAEYEAQKPKNFEMVQVKPNWHDSSELIGYVSRVSGSPVFVAGDFLKFVAKAWENPDVPYFLCLDEMNLAPVEQYFAEYLSVVESRKADENGVITTDPILKKCEEQWYFDLTAQLTRDDEVRARFNKDGIAIPQNLIVVGTVNMDETTFSFSRKVLDRAMTIEMNEVDLYGGLDDRHEKIGKLEAGNLIGTAVEGVDVYRENKDVCDTALKYLQAVNLNLEGTPFKVAYRTRNEFLLYVVNNLPYNKDMEGNEIPQQEVIARALDEITSMKILSRIEGDSDKIGNLLEELGKTVSEQLNVISGKDYSEKKNDGEKVYSVSLAKLKEMEDRLKSGYTSFWS